ncbi:carboxy-S-adenosyl-L-methionine synthase CmoA [Chryseobacterium daecheongense]|uniref:Carboxy-S-adenosyl-L-methionine synthase n=1 Tax=Chryseobacterium daecheongense TaxID=192389 RepID=A0A3N0W602_9FLAO|nr:carboxy-S-adenosyl-L-methionine synthase CmoA [Chryseobacterium daecheongense]ROI00490.1 carboxy-S-adenosyl-L-methionine synthase CmoA [Chryseobacterium daecheongense]TDX94535.1 tRNA (cmo5U34)-methyltransferase [Chryseobacterium daecheongense]
MSETFNSDQVFKEKLESLSDFEFNTKVAGVFDDMVSRSVPFYDELQRMTSELAGNHAQPGSYVYDLGCSTGTTMLLMDKTVPEGIDFIGIDDSEEMILKCREKLDNFKLNRNVELQVADLTKKVPVQNASVVTMVLVLQFIRPINRLSIVKKICDGMLKNGVFILIEKVLTEEKPFNREFIDYYYDFKRRNNYSELEISQKREALENVLIPYKTSENINMLHEAGFDEVEVFFRWYNFTGIIAKKS